MYLNNMFMSEPAHFIKAFVTDLDIALVKLKPNAKLTQLQRFWLGFCLTGDVADQFGVLGKVRACKLGQL